MEKSQKEKASLEGLSKSVRARLEHQNFSPIRWVHKVYKVTLSPVFACFGAECRFIPDCSSYALDAIESRGFLHGGMLAVRRLCRCHPWCAGGHDPVPREAVSDIRFVSPDIRNQVNSCRDPCKISS